MAGVEAGFPGTGGSLSPPVLLVLQAEGVEACLTERARRDDRGRWAWGSSGTGEAWMEMSWDELTKTHSTVTRR